MSEDKVLPIVNELIAQGKMATGRQPSEPTFDLYPHQRKMLDRLLATRNPEQDNVFLERIQQYMRDRRNGLHDEVAFLTLDSMPDELFLDSINKEALAQLKRTDPVFVVSYPSRHQDMFQQLERVKQREGKSQYHLVPMELSPKDIENRIAIKAEAPAADEQHSVHGRVVNNARRRSTNMSSLQTAMMMAALSPGLVGGIDLDNPFAALERRTLSREEAKAAFTTSDADKERQAKAEAKRQRKAAKLRRQSGG